MTDLIHPRHCAVHRWVGSHARPVFFGPWSAMTFNLEEKEAMMFEGLAIYTVGDSVHDGGEVALYEQEIVKRRDRREL